MYRTGTERNLSRNRILVHLFTINKHIWHILKFFSYYLNLRFTYIFFDNSLNIFLGLSRRFKLPPPIQSIWKPTNSEFVSS